MISNSVSKKSPAIRSSLACVPCRNRHIKCDGERPQCNRCREAQQQCQYTRSRRGGLDRAALMERRRRLAATRSNSSSTSPNGSSSGSPRSIISKITSPQSPAWAQQDNCQIYQAVDIQIPDNVGYHHGANAAYSSPASWESLVDGPYDIENDALIDSYYKSFHRFHPLALPRRYLAKMYRDSHMQPRYTPLIAVLRFIGSLYSTLEWSLPLKDSVETSISDASQNDPILVQCRLLYSIALFWYRHQKESKRELDAAARLALDLGMFRRDFAAEYGSGDPILTESWRRTWWMLYVVDAYYTGTLGTMEFAVMDVEVTVDLPCEEVDYESGVSTFPSLLCLDFSATHWLVD